MSADGTLRTWHLPLATRIVVATARLIVCMAIPGLWLSFTLVGDQAPSEHWWITFAVFAAVWCLPTWRAWTQSVTLDWDTLVIRNFFHTEEVSLTNIAWIRFRWGRLTVTPRRGRRSRERIKINVANLGISYFTGRRSRPDEIAAAIASAAGLPPLSPRKQIIGPRGSLLLLLAGATSLTLGIYRRQPGIANADSSLLLQELVSIGIYVMCFAALLLIDYWRKHRQTR